MTTANRMVGLVVVLAAACGNGGQAPEPQPQPPSAAANEERPAPPRPVIGEALRVERAKAAAGPARERIYDFAANLDQAHLRSGGLLVDLGSPARHKHTLGDWKTGWYGDFTREETSFSYIDSAAARIFFDARPDEAGGGKLTVRARAVGGTTAKVYLNERHLGVLEFPRDSFSHATLSFAQGIVAGPNEIMLRTGQRRPGHDGHAVALAVDYVRVVPEGADEGPAAAASDAPRYPGPSGGTPGLALVSGESLTYNLPFPAGAAVQGVVRARGPGAEGRLEVRLQDDAGTERILGEVAADERSTEWAFSLGAEAGTGAITIAATAGELLLSGAGLTAPPRSGQRAPGKPSARNLVLVLIDTLRADHLALYDPDSRVQTGYLDRLGAESMVFERPLAQENWTKPSVATLLTGLYPETHRTKDEKHKVPTTVVLASEHFRGLGFATAGLVANGYVSGKFGFERGWDHWINYVREGKPNRAKFVADDAVAWLARRPKDKPFFLYVHTIDPHVPYIPPHEYTALYDDQPYQGPVQPRSTAKLLEQIKTGAVKLSGRDKLRLEALYDGEISYHDAQFARVHEALAEQGLLEDTLIIVTSDHGEEFFEHGSVGHGHTLYEELLHVPLIVRLPGAATADGGARSRAEVGLVDVLPTACEILGVECPAGVEGRSLVPLLEGRAGDRWPEVQFADFLGGQRVARMGRYKLIYRGLNTTLFDLEADPRETSDLSDARPVSFATVRDLLGQHQGRFVPGDDATDGAATPGAGGRPPRRPQHRAEETEIDPATRDQLKALGYMGD